MGLNVTSIDVDIRANIESEEEITDQEMGEISQYSTDSRDVRVTRHNEIQVLSKHEVAETFDTLFDIIESVNYELSEPYINQIFIKCESSYSQEEFKTLIQNGLARYIGNDDGIGITAQYGDMEIRLHPDDNHVTITIPNVEESPEYIGDFLDMIMVEIAEDVLVQD